MRRRARHRLIGAVVLVLVGVVGFPLLFDTQPRPIAVDLPIEIPDRNKVKPLAPPPAAPVAPSAAGKVAVAPVPAPAVTPAPAAEAVKPAPPEKTEVARPAPKPEPKPEAKAETKPADGAKALALLEGRQVEAGEGARFVVQVGAYADPVKAREARQKVEKAGLKTYTHVAETKDGKRIRVRTGPYASRAEADKAAEKIKGLDLPAAILSL